MELLIYPNNDGEKLVIWLPSGILANSLPWLLCEQQMILGDPRIVRKWKVNSKWDCGMQFLRLCHPWLGEILQNYGYMGVTNASVCKLLHVAQVGQYFVY